MQLLEGIDPNPENYVMAGIIHTKTQQIGVLCRLEPNTQAMVSTKNVICKINHNDNVFLQMFRLTVRSSKDMVSQTVCELLYEQF